MDRHLEQLISEAARGLEAAEGFGTSEQMDFTGFRGRVERMDDLLIAALFPQHAGHLKSLDIPARLAREQYLHEAMGHLQRCVESVMTEKDARERIVPAMLAALPEIRRQLGTDLIAAYQGDPAAKSPDEVILCYPAFTAKHPVNKRESNLRVYLHDDVTLKRWYSHNTDYRRICQRLDKFLISQLLNRGHLNIHQCSQMCRQVRIQKSGKTLMKHEERSYLVLRKLIWPFEVVCLNFLLFFVCFYFFCRYGSV